MGGGGGMRNSTLYKGDSADRKDLDLWAKLTERETEILKLYLRQPNDKTGQSHLKWR